MDVLVAAEAVTAFIPPAWLVPGGATVLLGVVFLMIVRGVLVPANLVPRAVYDDMRRERDEWKTLALATMQQNSQLLQGTQVVTDVLSSFPSARPKGQG